MSGHILFAYMLNGPERGRRLAQEAEIVGGLQAAELAWLHLRARHPRTEGWMRERLGWLDPLVLAALLAEETRPRAAALGKGMLLILRGVNLNPGQEPEDMVSIRIYADPARVVSTSVRDLVSVADLRAQIEAGQGPENAGSFIARLIDRLNDRIGEFLHRLEEDCDEIEARLLDGPEPELRGRISEARRRLILFRRHVGPQREALASLLREDSGLFDKRAQRLVAEAHERLTRTIEDADALRDRLAVVRDELQNAISERLGRNLYLLSIITVVFLPISFVTGLLGINVGGIPGSASKIGFWIVCAILLGMVVGVLWLLRRLRWI
jgi:zinc transporter